MFHPLPVADRAVGTAEADAQFSQAFHGLVLKLHGHGGKRIVHLGTRRHRPDQLGKHFAQALRAVHAAQVAQLHQGVVVALQVGGVGRRERRSQGGVQRLQAQLLIWHLASVGSCGAHEPEGAAVNARKREAGGGRVVRHRENDAGPDAHGCVQLVVQLRLQVGRVVMARRQRGHVGAGRHHGADEVDLVVGGVDPLDGDNSQAALSAMEKAFVVSLEIAPSAVTARANVVLPVAAVTEKSGSFLNWEGRARSFDAAVADSLNRSDLRILSMIADEMGISLNLGTVTAAAREIASLGTWDGARATFNKVSAQAQPALNGDQALITSWRRLLDLGTLQEGEEHLAGTARRTVAVISPKRAQSMGVVDGDQLRISTAQGSVTLSALVENIHDDAVWAPRNSRGSQLLVNLGVAHGAVVTVVKA